MKENLDIEKLFKDKFENFEADVNPNLWTNISQGIQTTAVSTTTGISIGIKALIVGSVVTAVGVATYYFGGFNHQTQQAKQQVEQINNNENSQEVKTLNQDVNGTSTIIAQDNDPVIDAHQDEIIEELIQNQSTVETNQSNDFTETNTNLVKEQANTTTDLNTTTENHQITNDVSKTNTSTESQNDQTNGNTINDLSNDTEDIIVFPTGKIDVKSTSNKFKYQFTSNAINTEKVMWYFGDGTSSTDLNPTHTYQKPGEYEVTLTLISKDNEMYEETKTITIKAESSIDNIPNVITPNGDRINDEFVIKTKNIAEFNIVIKDKFDNVIFESNDKNFAWDGNDKSGNRVENGLYIYYIFAKGTDGSVYKIPGQIYVR